MCYVGATCGAPWLAGASLCLGAGPYPHMGSSQARAPHGDQKSCVLIPSSWTSAAEGRAGRGERRGLGQEHTAALRVGHCEAHARGQVGCGEGVNQALDPRTHLPPGPPLSQGSGGGGSSRGRGREGQGQPLVVNGAVGERRRHGQGLRDPASACLCRATSSRLWGNPSPSALPGPATHPGLKASAHQGSG